MKILRTSRSKWIVGTVAVVIVSAGTLLGTPTGGKQLNLPLNMKTQTSSSDFAALTTPGTVPANIFEAILVPAQSTRTGWQNYDQGNGPYDRQIDIAVPADGPKTKAFFVAALGDKAWKTLSAKTITNGYQILALHPGNDGHFWEVGITITNQPSDIAPLGLATHASSATSRFTPVAIRLLQYEPA